MCVRFRGIYIQQTVGNENHNVFITWEWVFYLFLQLPPKWKTWQRLQRGPSKIWASLEVMLGRPTCLRWEAEQRDFTLFQPVTSPLDVNKRLLENPFLNLYIHSNAGDKNSDSSYFFLISTDDERSGVMLSTEACLQHKVAQWNMWISLMYLQK